MKTAKYTSIALYVLAVFIFNSTYCQNQNHTYSPVEIIAADLNDDKVLDTIIIYQRPVEGDPGLFTKINISLGMYGRKTFQAKDVWDSVSLDFKKKNSNSINSKNIFVHKDGSTAYIFLFGFLYGTGREEIAIIKVKGSKAELYFHNELAEPQVLADLDSDGIKELICRYPPEIYSYDQNTEAEIGAYSPFLIYKLENEFLLDKKLTEKYNKEHYIWEGLKYDDTISVVYPSGNKKPYKQ